MHVRLDGQGPQKATSSNTTMALVVQVSVQVMEEAALVEHAWPQRPPFRSRDSLHVQLCEEPEPVERDAHNHMHGQQVVQTAPTVLPQIQFSL